MVKLLCNGILFILLFASCNPEPVKIGLQPYDNICSALTDTLENVIKAVYGFDVVILPARPMPRNAIVQIKSFRYRADSLLKDLKNNKPNSCRYILGITNVDISISKRDESGEIKKPISKYSDWGVFGLGYRPGPSCIISTYRLKHADNKLFTLRLKKVSIHEIGHNLGLKHCNTKACVMQDAVETIRTIDFVGLELCPQCKKQIKAYKL